MQDFFFKKIKKNKKKTGEIVSEKVVKDEKIAIIPLFLPKRKEKTLILEKTDNADHRYSYYDFLYNHESGSLPLLISCG
jgi:hypothetical protein